MFTQSKLVLGAVLALAASTLPQSALAGDRARPDCGGIQSDLKVGTKCSVASSDVYAILAIMTDNPAEFAKLTAEGRRISAIRLEIRKPKGENLSNTRRYTIQ